jgi:hypothetical protein
MQHVENIQYVYLLNKYLKCSVCRLAVRYDPYMGHLAPNGYTSVATSDVFLAYGHACSSRGYESIIQV